MLTREHIFAADDLPRVKVDVPEWGGSVYVRVMTGAELFRSATLDGLSVVALATVNEKGEPLFTADDVEALSSKNGAVLMRLFQEIVSLNALSVDNVDEAGND